MNRKIYLINESTLIFPNHINNQILNVLKEWGFSNYFYMFKNNLELLPLIANLVNYSAKEISDEYYAIKQELLEFLIANHNWTWFDGNQEVVYFETPYGQVSFHIHYSENIDKKVGISNDGRKWSGKELQLNGAAVELIEDVIQDNL